MKLGNGEWIGIKQSNSSERKGEQTNIRKGKKEKKMKKQLEKTQRALQKLEMMK
jgi:hypothetical protein